MEKLYKNILLPFRIGNVVLKNRLISTNASLHFLQGPETYPADPVMTFVRNIARSGASIIMFAEWANPAQRTTGVPDMIRMQNFDLTDPSTHNYLSQMAEDVHYYDSKLCVSLIHSMPHGYVFSPAGEPPKDLKLRPGENYHGAIMQMGTEAKDPEELPADRIQEAIAPLVEKIRFYQELGYDMVALDSRPIISAYNNLRTDEYGGSFENRCRFLVETCEAIKAAAGQDFLILIFCDAWKGGYTPEDAAVMAKLLEHKADILMFRKGDSSTYNINPESYKDLLKYTEAVKRSGAEMAVCVNSSAMDIDTNDSIIAEGRADFIGLGRGFICENQYVQKAQEGRPEDIAPCLLCNKCHGNMHAPWISYCSINPTVGLAHKVDRMVTPVTRKNGWR